VTDAAIREQGVAMYNAIFPKLDKCQRVIDVPDDVENPATGDEILGYIAVLVISAVGLVISKK